MITYLKNMEGCKHKDLKSKDFDSIKELFDKAFKRVNMFEDFRTDLVEAEVDDDQEATKIKELMEIVPNKEEVAIDAIPLAVKSSRIIYMLVEKKYPLTPPTLSQMLEKKLQIDYQSEMAYQLFYGRIVGIKSFLMMFGVTAALIDVNAAESNLVLLVNFNENYSKCLRLLVKLQLLEEVTTASVKLLLLVHISTAQRLRRKTAK
ncbi:hypothetical protein Tco_0292307 [Tanacetum coccineum]